MTTGEVGGELGPYRLGLLLGEGGMGEVYKAFDDRLGRWVAAKRLRGDAGAEARERFRREARTLARLGHPGIVQIFDIVEDQAGDWIVMELVEGSTLAELGTGGPLDVGLAIDFGRQIASALGAAHASGIVHRDLKTENVMVLPFGHAAAGRIKVLDFGLAGGVTTISAAGMLAAGRRTTVSQPGRIAGTPRAMSPEQASGIGAGARSDLFSLGVLLYEISTARSPFLARTSEETLRRVVHHHPPPARRLNPRIPGEFSELIARLLEKDPRRRPRTATAVAAGLAAIAAVDPVYRVSSCDLSRIESTSQIPRLGVGATTADAAVGDAGHDDAVVATLLSSALVAAGGLGEELGGPEAKALVQRRNRLARDLLEVHGGKEIDLGGGAAFERANSLLLFDRPWNAVSYALAYHEGLRRDPLGPALVARVGIHLSEMILRRDAPLDVAGGDRSIELGGPAAPSVARLASLAAGGQTLLTRAACEMARRGAASEPDRDLRHPFGGIEENLQWRSHGHYRFRGIGDVEVFEVGVPGVAPLSAPDGSREVRRVLPRGDKREYRQRADRWDLARASLETASAVPASAPGQRPATSRGARIPMVTIRVWPPPEPPEQPYPVLLPYSHPDFMAGRAREVARLRRLLEMPVPILGLAAPSGVGKSSLLLGGLVPTLRAARVPVALVRHPAEAGVASRLIGDLLDGAEPVDDRDARGFVERLAEVERLAGRAPILVLDQFEDVLGKGAEARIKLGILMAASVARRPGLTAPTCRWLIAYRREFYGRLNAWLGDVLANARALGVAGIEALPHDLSRVERFHSMALAPLATPPPAAREPLVESTRVFLAAIEKPLALADTSPPGPGSASGSPLPQGEGRGVRGGDACVAPTDPGRTRGEGTCPWHFPPGHAERLARAFAEARLASPDAPLAPELQVVLAHLLAEAGVDGRVTVPDDPGPLIDRALEDHLRRAPEAAFPESTARATRRARALLALRELCVGPAPGGHATAAGRRVVSRREGLGAGDLARVIGDDGEQILEALATPLTRLVVVRDAPDCNPAGSAGILPAGGPRWVLAHDRMAEAVVRLVEEEGRSGKLLIDSELLALRRFVTLRTALHRSGEVKASTRVPRHRFRRIWEHAEALLRDDEARAWFAACRRRRRADRQRLAAIAAVVTLFLALVGSGAWTWARRLAEHRALLEQVAQGEPETTFRALDVLASRSDGDGPVPDAELLDLLRQRDAPMDVLESGLGGLDGPRRGAAVLRAVEIALPWVEETPRDPALIANLVWALDFAPGRDRLFAERARALREQVLAPLRRLRPAPPLPAAGDPDWIQVPAGRFQMGTGSEEKGEDRERPRHEVTVSAFRMQRHEVTNAEYRRLVPDHHLGAGDDLPALNVNWYAAYTYAAWLGGRLPTEAEWEYAARAGCPYAYCTRDGRETTADTVAWTQESSRDATAGEIGPPWPVMRLEPNPWGFYDMLGNLWEWTVDWSGAYQGGPRRDPWGSSVSNGGTRVVRGGAFHFSAGRARVAHRTWGKPGTKIVKRGLRPVLP